MNSIYFDNLPETIAKSSNQDDVNTTEVRMWFKSDVKISPLTDRLAEERKKVVCDIKEKLLDGTSCEILPTGDICISLDKINNVLDQIERGTDD